MHRPAHQYGVPTPWEGDTAAAADWLTRPCMSMSGSVDCYRCKLLREQVRHGVEHCRLCSMPRLQLLSWLHLVLSTGTCMHAYVVQACARLRKHVTKL